MGETVKFTWPTYNKQLCDGIIKLLKEDFQTDFKISGGLDQEKRHLVKVHHLIVSIFCPVLKNLNEKEVELSNCSTEDIKILMEFVYTGKASINKDRLLSVKSGAKAIGLDCLVQSIDTYFKMRIKQKVPDSSDPKEQNQEQSKSSDDSADGNVEDDGLDKQQSGQLKPQSVAKTITKKPGEVLKRSSKLFILRQAARNRSYEDPKDFACNHCSFRTTARHQLIPHLAIKHHVDIDGNKIEQNIKCPHCSYTCWSPNQLKQHRIFKHSTVKYNCDQCAYVCVTRNRMQKHKEFAHSEERPIMCETCGRRFKEIRTYKKHQQVHKGIIKANCDICGKIVMASSLKRHMKIHLSDEKPHQCHLCSYATRARFNLRIHLRNVHKVSMDKHGNLTNIADDNVTETTTTTFVPLHLSAENYEEAVHNLLLANPPS
ncbi:hypothetical protein CHUAL_002040 [Chamberlinius hualienensis]